MSTLAMGAKASQAERFDMARAATADMDELLSQLPQLPQGSKVAVVSMLGSLCPITLGHVQCFKEARKLLLNDAPSTPRPLQLEEFQECLGFVHLNGDAYVGSKLREKGQMALDMKARAQCVHLATTEMPWLRYSESPGDCLFRLRNSFRHIQFVEFDMNGADDVVKYRKWMHAGVYYRMITMGRPGYTEDVRRGMQAAKKAEEHCLLGPELPDISSTTARTLAACGDTTRILDILHPAVANWFLKSYGHPGLDLTCFEDEKAT